MKTKSIYISVLLLIITLSSCEETKVTYPQYEISTDYYCPDSLKEKQSEWIKETIRATDQHLAAGDYEDPEDVINTVYYKAQGLFSVRGEGLNVITSKYSSSFVSFQDMTPREKLIFKYLKSKQ